MPILPKIIKDKSPSCCYLNDRRNLVCVVKDLYDQMNVNYDFISSGISDDLIDQIIAKVLEEIDIDGINSATEDQVDNLFGD